MCVTKTMEMDAYRTAQREFKNLTCRNGARRSSETSSKDVSRLNRVIAKGKGPTEGYISISSGIFTVSAEQTVQALVDSHFPIPRAQPCEDYQFRASTVVPRTGSRDLAETYLRVK